MSIKDLISLKKVRKHIESKRTSSSFFWRSLVFLKDRIYYFPRSFLFLSESFLYFFVLRYGRLFEPKFSSKKHYTIKTIAFYYPEANKKQYFEKFTKKNGTWNSLTLTDKKYADFYIILNHPNNRLFSYYNPKRTLVFHLEPEATRKTWGRWANPSPKTFFYVFDMKNHRMNTEWYLSKNYTWLMNNKIQKSKTLSTITSENYSLPGHKKRLDFLQLLDQKMLIDTFGWTMDRVYDDRPRLASFRHYKGALPSFNKEIGLFPYKYTFASENSSEKNYFTEKLIDAILSECLCFYWGCPNVDKFIDPRAYIKIDLDDPKKAITTIKKAIKDNEWEKRIDIIRKEKVKILNESQMMPTIERIIKENISKKL